MIIMNKDVIDYIETDDQEVNEKREALLGETYPNKKELFAEMQVALQSGEELSEELTEFSKLRMEIIRDNPYSHKIHRKDGKVLELGQGEFQIMKQEMVMKQG